METNREYLLLLERIRSALHLLERTYRCLSYEIVRYVNQETTHNYYSKDISLFKNLNKHHFHSVAKREKLKDFAYALERLIELKAKESRIMDSDVEKEAILKVVFDGLQNEFELYKAIPTIQKRVELLAQTYCPETSAYKKIIDLAQRNQQQGWVLSNEGNPSYFKIIDAFILDLKVDQAHIQTKEYWLLMWYDPKTMDYAYEYQKENDQTYVLVLKNGKWLIETNEYETNTGKIPPKLFKPEIYDEVELTKEILHQKLQDFIGTGNLESAVEIIYAFADQQKIKDLKWEVMAIRGSVYALMKQLNMSRITFDEYQVSARKIARELYELVDKFEENEK